MNVLQILPELKSGGVERGTVDLAKYLAKRGHRAVVVSAGGPLVADLAAAGVAHYKLPVHRKSPFSIWRSAKELARIIEHERIEVVHARSRVPAIVAFLACRRTQVPFVTTCHGFYSRHLLSRPMGWGKRVIVASHIIGRRMRDDFGVPHERIRLIPRGVNLEEFKPRRPADASVAGDPARLPAGQAGSASRETVIGLIGRITPIKGHPLFLKAMARVARVFPEVKIQIIGDAPKPQYKEELLSLARHLGLSQRVQFLGTRYDISQLLAGMTILVVPSVGEEAFGRVAIEAGACEVPVVATRVGGLVDVIENEKSGLLVPPDDPRLLADAVIRLLKDRELAAKLAANLRKKVEREFTLEQMFDKTLEVYREAIASQRILVMKLSAVGDIILSVPALRAIRKRHPAAWISVLVGSRGRTLLKNCPYVNDVIACDDADGWRAVARTARILARENFDVVIDLQNNRKSHLLAYLSGARVRAGYARRKASFLLNRTCKDPGEPTPPLEHQLRVLKLAGIDEIEPKLELWAGEEEKRSMDRFLDSHWVSKSQVLVGINPGSSPRWPTKQWAPEQFAKLCDELSKRNIRVVLTGAKEDEAIAERVLELTKNRPISAVGKTSLSELVALVGRCHAFVSSDSAPMHVASSVGVPLVALFGPTDPKRHLVPPAVHRVFWKEVPCAPCYLRSCPVGHLCMKQIGVSEVLEAILSFLPGRRRATEPASPAGRPATAGRPASAGA